MIYLFFLMLFFSPLKDHFDAAAIIHQSSHHKYIFMHSSERDAMTYKINHVELVAMAALLRVNGMIYSVNLN